MSMQIDFRNGVQSALEASDFTSCRSLSFAAGGSEPQVQKIVNGHFDTSANGPGVFFIHRLAKAMGTTIDSFFGGDTPDATTSDSALNDWPYMSEINFNSFINAYTRGAGRIEALDPLRDFFDLYCPPSDGDHTPKIVKVGFKSLMGLRLKTTCLETAQKELDRLQPKKRREIIESHRDALSSGMSCSVTAIDHALFSVPSHVRATYSKLCLHVTNAEGKPFIAVYCQPVPV